MTINPTKIEPRDDWEYAQEIAAEEEAARKSNPETKSENDDPFDVFEDYFNVAEIKESK